MAKGCRSRWLMTIVMGLCALVVIGTRAIPAQAQRQGRFIEDVVTSGSGFNQDRHRDEPIEWTHSLSSADVAAANSGGVIVDAFDVDYPSAAEHDRLWINGNDYGLLEGQNNQWGATEKSIRINHLGPGPNRFRVDPDVGPEPPSWRLRIRRSTLFLYTDEDFDINVTPDRRSVDIFGKTTYEVQINWIGVWDNPVDLSVSGLPKGAIAVFSPKVISGDGGTSKMTVTLENVTPGRYPLTITGRGTADYEDEGGSRSVTHTAPVDLVVKVADLVITKRQSQTTVKPNMVQTYTIKVKNKGESPATNVVVMDMLSGDLTYVSDTAADAIHSEENGQHRWEFAKPLRPAASFSFNINTRVTPFVRAGRSIANKAQVTADQALEPIVSNTVTAVSGFEAVKSDDLRVVKRALKRDARVGGILTYRIEVENVSSTGPIFDIELTDRMPNGFKIPDGKTLRDGALFDDPQVRGRTFTWQLGNLGPGDRTVVIYQAVVGTNAASGRNENIAEARGTDGGGNRVRGRDSAIVMLGAGDLEILGQITVSTCLDVNGNQRVDGSDEPLGGIDVIRVPQGIRQTTDDQKGETIFTDLKSGQYLVAVDELRLPEDLFVHEGSSQMVRLMEGESADVSFLLFKDPGLGKLIIRPFFDANGNGVLDDNEELVPNFDAALEDTVKSTGNSEQAIFTRLEPGSYELKITASGRSLTQTVAVKGGVNEVDIPVSVSRLKITIRKSNN